MARDSSPLSPDDRRRLWRAARSSDERLTLGLFLETGITLAEFCDFGLRAKVSRGHRGGVVKLDKRRMPLSYGVYRLIPRGEWSVSKRTVQRLVDRLAVRARLERRVTPRALRHTYATERMRQGATLELIRAELGLKNASSILRFWLGLQ